MVGGLTVGMKSDRESFNRDRAPELAGALGVSPAPVNGPKERFAHFDDGDRFVMVAGEQEGKHVERALGRGLHLREGRQLVLVVPEGHSFATIQRSPWLKDEARPDIYLHDGSSLHSEEPVRLGRLEQTIDELTMRLEGKSLEEEFAAATTPAHLGDRSRGVAELVEWATTDPRLDAAHRRGGRSWHYMGLGVLSIRGASEGLRITAGVHHTGEQAPSPLVLKRGEALQGGRLEDVKEKVEEGIAIRRSGDRLHRPDEAWLQAVIRREPRSVGVEQPALREVPAWRPRDTPKKWGRGYIDLAGVDGHGDIRIVETKLAKNDDELLILQGLDYYVWARAYRDVLSRRLGAPRRARLELHYVIGSNEDGQVTVPHLAPAQVNSLNEDIRWRFQTVRDWFHDSDHAADPETELHDLRTVPA